MNKQLLLVLICCLPYCLQAQNSKRWQLQKDNSIQWNVGHNDDHVDHIEMSGLQVSAIIKYGTQGGGLVLDKKLVFPMLRTIPNNTHASLIVDFNDNSRFQISANNVVLKETPKQFNLYGKLDITSQTNTSITVSRTVFPSTDKPALIEIIRLKNNGKENYSINAKNLFSVKRTDAAKGVYGQYIVEAQFTDTLSHNLTPGETYTYTIAYTGKKNADPVYAYSADLELGKRMDLIKKLNTNLVLETPNDTLNQAFNFAKIRTSESIYDTKGGLMHGPGGGAYYAAIWANDQAEYANPFFPFLGYLYGNESAINSYRMFARYMNPEYKPIPSSIIAEGTDFWNGAGDRGDMAMIAYGASRYALALGKKEIGQELWPLISWCFEYLERQKTTEGVYKSNSDELEGRAPAGKINLSTNSLTYGGYISAANLAEELGKKDVAITYRKRAAELRQAIDKYFGANVQGFDTYRYYDGNTILRAWICMPLAMGITERKAETIKALLSPYLWTNNGILTQAGDKVFWDRGTLYTFRALMSSGAVDQCMPYFNYYSATRLLGEHVPYAVEAWPEGGQRHLAAESALYCRVITEGLFDITPIGFRKFSISPRLPKGWKTMKLKNVKAFDETFDVEVSQSGAMETIKIKLQNGKTLQQAWNKKEPVVFQL